MIDAAYDLAFTFQTMPDDQIDILGPQMLIEHRAPLVKPVGTWGPCGFSVSIYGIEGAGDTMVAAIRQWSDCALRMAREAAA